jgi:hypothetical protein
VTPLSLKQPFKSETSFAKRVNANKHFNAGLYVYIPTKEDFELERSIHPSFPGSAVDRCEILFGLTRILK